MRAMIWLIVLWILPVMFLIYSLLWLIWYFNHLLVQLCTSCKIWKTLQLLNSRRSTIATECQIMHDSICADIKVQFSWSFSLNVITFFLWLHEISKDATSFSLDLRIVMLFSFGIIVLMLLFCLFRKELMDFVGCFNGIVKLHDATSTCIPWIFHHNNDC